MGHELGDENGVHVLRCVGVQRGPLGMGRELGDVHVCYVLWCVGVQRGPLNENLSSSVISGTFYRENRFRRKRQKTPENRKTHQARTLPKREAIFATFP